MFNFMAAVNCLPLLFVRCFVFPLFLWAQEDDDIDKDGH